MGNKPSKFYNKTLKNNFKKSSALIESELDELINRYPISKRMYVALLLTISDQKEKGISVDDWECDFSNVIWPEVQDH